MANDSLVYSFDIGATSIKHAIVDPFNRENPIVRSYPRINLISRSFEHLKSSVLSEIGRMSEQFPEINTIAISTTGDIDDKTGTAIRVRCFDGYTKISWREIVCKAFPQINHVFTVNDGKASAWAEFMGIGQNAEYFAHFVIGTGIGGATIVHKRFITGDGGYAGYIAHIHITDDKTIQCSCGAYGCVETMVSAPAIVHHYLNLQTGLSLSKGQNKEFADIVVSVYQGDETAIKAVQRGGYYLGKTIAAVMNIFNPGAITLGGGVVSAFNNLNPNIFVESAEESARLHSHPFVREFTTIKPGRYGNDAGVIGAAELAFLDNLPI